MHLLEDIPSVFLLLLKKSLNARATNHQALGWGRVFKARLNYYSSLVTTVVQRYTDGPNHWAH
jgi:hypothetical protein